MKVVDDRVKPGHDDCTTISNWLSGTVE
jgi:hypothetical protein